MSPLQDVLEQVSGAIPGCVFTSVVDADSGMALATAGAGDLLASASADAYQSELQRAVRRTLDALSLDQSLETVVVIAANHVFISIPLAGSSFFWHVVTNVSTTIGFTRAILRKSQGQVVEALGPLL